MTLCKRWSQLCIKLTAPTWVAADGKRINSTLSDDTESYQNLMTSVSALTPQRGVVLHGQLMPNKQTSEIAVMRQCIAAFAGQPVVFTHAALHCQKTVHQIHAQQQPYLMALQAHQRTLERPLPH